MSSIAVVYEAQSDPMVSQSIFNNPTIIGAKLNISHVTFAVPSRLANTA